MKDELKWTGVGILAIVGMLALSVGLIAFRIEVMRIFGVEMESVRTDIYRENKSYVEGTVRDLRELRVEYEKASDSHKAALRSLIMQRAGELDWERLPGDLRDFLEEL